jgi:biopolymer transport protein ExbD
MSQTESDDRAITGINVTPLVDVTLVLLIVFMVTAKVIVSQAIPITVPAVAKSGQVDAILTVAIDEHGAMSIDGVAIDHAELARRAREARAHGDVKAVLRASKDASHGAVVAAMDDLRGADITNIAFAVARK